MLNGHLLCAQFQDSLDACIKRGGKLTGSFGTRNSFISQSRADIFGIKGGVSFGRKLRVGGGFFFLKQRDGSPLNYKQALYNPETGLEENVQLKLNLYYWAYYVEYVYHKSKRWEFSTPLQFGIGASSYSYHFSDHKERHQTHLVLLYEPGVSIEYSIFQWLGVSGHIGYRFMLKNNRSIRQSFNSPMYAAGISIYWDELFKLAFPESKWAKML